MACRRCSGSAGTAAHSGKQSARHIRPPSAPRGASELVRCGAADRTGIRRSGNGGSPNAATAAAQPGIPQQVEPAVLTETEIEHEPRGETRQLDRRRWAGEGGNPLLTKNDLGPPKSQSALPLPPFLPVPKSPRPPPCRREPQAAAAREGLVAGGARASRRS